MKRIVFIIAVVALGLITVTACGQKKEKKNYCCPLKVSEQRDIHPQCCCNGIADDFSEGKPLS